MTALDSHDHSSTPESLPLRIGIVTMSDRASQGVYEDKSGPAIQQCLQQWLSVPFEIVRHVIADEAEAIHDALVDCCDQRHCSLVVTTGGTGPAPRDITPEITEQVCDKMLPGFGELMRQVSLQVVPTAILSRQTAGTRGHSLIINLPGKPSAIDDCLRAVFPAVPYCIDLIGGAWIACDPEHMQVFRPKHAVKSR